jgi:hypothetical protein
MSSTDPSDGLTDKERAAFDKYTDFCKKNFDKLAVEKQRGCSDHLATLRLMTQQKLAQQELVKNLEVIQTEVDELSCK